APRARPGAVRVAGAARGGGAVVTHLRLRADRAVAADRRHAGARAVRVARAARVLEAVVADLVTDRHPITAHRGADRRARSIALPARLLDAIAVAAVSVEGVAVVAGLAGAHRPVAAHDVRTAVSGIHPAFAHL